MRPSKHPRKPKARHCAIPSSQLGSLEALIASPSLSRRQALASVLRAFEGDSLPLAQESTVLRLVGLFDLQPEDLLEAGLSYEALKAIEPRCWPRG